MPERYPDEKYIEAKALLNQRDAYIKEVAKISKEIKRLTALRDQVRTEARRLKSSNIAQDLGVSQSWVEKIAECRHTRDLPIFTQVDVH